MSSTTRRVAVVAIAALLGGFLLAVVLTQPNDNVPAAGGSAVPVPGAADRVSDLALAPDGSLWAATGAGIVRWDLADSSPRVFTELDGLPNRSVQQVAVAPDGAVWALGDDWLARYDGTWTLIGDDVVDVDLLTPVRDIAVGPDGTAWVAAGGPNALIRIDASGTTTVPVPEPEGSATPSVGSLAVDPAGTIWASSFMSGVFAYDGAWRHFGVDDGLPSDIVGNIALAPDGTVWVGGDGLYGGPAGDVPAGGIARLDGSSWTSYTTADGLLSNDGAVKVGPGGDVWAIHTGFPEEVADALGFQLPSGLSRYDGTRWETYPDVATGYGGRAAVATDGTLWMASADGLLGFDGTTERRLVAGTEVVPPLVLRPAGPPVSMERAVGLDPVRLSTSIGELEFTTYVHPDGEEPPYGMTETAHGVIAMGGSDGGPVWSLDGITWTEMPRAGEPSGWSDRSPAFGDDVVAWEADNAVARATWDGEAWADAELLPDTRIDGSRELVVGPRGIVFVHGRIYYWDGSEFSAATRPPDPSLHPGSSAGCSIQRGWSGWSLLPELGPVAATDDGFIALAARNEDDGHMFPVCEPLVWLSADGNEWVPTTEESPFGEGAVIRDLAVTDGRIVAVGDTAPERAAVWVSDDGITWQHTVLDSHGMLRVAGSARGWIAVGYGDMWFSPDGIVWDGPYQRPPGWGDTWGIVGVAMLDDRIIGVGEMQVARPEGSPASGLVVGEFIDD